MIFTDWKFFVFFAITFTIYWAIPGRRLRKVWLLIGSAVFYAFWDWRFLFLIVFVVANTYVTGLAVAGLKEDARRRRVLTTGIVLSLSVLGFFKYFNFFQASLLDLMTTLGVSVSSTTLYVLLPVGISFYTFHSLSYMVDVYRGKTQATANILDVGVYILFFPQLVAGPILRATDFMPQLREDKHFDAVNWRACLLLFLAGFVKKACIADNLSPLVDPVFAEPGKFGLGDAGVAVFCYAVQIYCDFSGYTDMAIATAAMMGYRLRPNFAHPYLAASLIDFWRRWHISLSSWLRDYLYIPLGGNRYGPLATTRNLMITMLLGGLWHGASWTFVFWGALHGVGLAINRVWEAQLGPWRARLPFAPALAYDAAALLLTFSWVLLAWIFFRAPTFAGAAAMFQAFARVSPPTLVPLPWFVPMVCALVAVHVTTRLVDLKSMTEAAPAWLFAALYGVAIALVLPFVNVKVTPFIYFQF